MFLNLQRQRRNFHPIQALITFVRGLDQAEAQMDQTGPLQSEAQIITQFDIAIACAALVLVLFVNLYF